MLDETKKSIQAATAARLDQLRIRITAASDELPPGWVARTAVGWDPFGDDPDANHYDGREHPEEAAIVDREADHQAKADAWLARAERLIDQGKVLAGARAETHALYHLGRQ